MNDFITLLLSFALGALTVAATEWYKSPKIRIEIAESADVRNGTLVRRFLQVDVINRPTWRWLRNIFSRESAAHAFGTIEFRHLDDTPLFPQMDGRWSASLEISQVVTGAIPFSPNLIEPLRFRDIFSNRIEPLTIAVKWGGEDECYGFNNISYFHPRFQNPIWRIPEGNFNVHVTISFGSETVERTFRLRNPRDIEHFLLEPLGRR